MASEAAKKARAAYYREWRRKNPDKAKAIRDRYWEKKAAQMAAEDQTEGAADNECERDIR